MQQSISRQFNFFFFNRSKEKITGIYQCKILFVCFWLYIFNVYVYMLLSYLYIKFNKRSRPVVHHYRVLMKNMILVHEEEQLWDLGVRWQKHDCKLVIIKWSFSWSIMELIVTLYAFHGAMAFQSEMVQLKTIPSK